MQKYTEVKENTPRFNRFDFEVGSGDGRGFQVRDVIRFFAVDIIVMAFLKLLLGLGLFQSPDTYVLAILASKVVLLFYLFWLIRDRRHAWPETGAATAGRWWGWPVSLALYAVCYPLLLYADRVNRMFMAKIYAAIGWEYVPVPQDVLLLIFEDIVASPVRIILVVFTVVIGPFMEELAFRGMGLDAFRRSSGTAWAVAWTSLLFGLYHFSLDLLLPLTMLGAIFAAVRLVSRSLWCSVLIHCLHNGLTLAVLVREFGIPEQLKFWQ